MEKGHFKKDVRASIRRHGNTLGVDHDPIQIQANGTIEWSCPDGDFTVVVHKRHGGGPLEHGRVLHGRKGQTVTAKVRPDACGSDETTYEYIVAAYIDGAVYAEDPDIVVGPETGEGEGDGTGGGG